MCLFPTKSKISGNKTSNIARTVDIANHHGGLTTFSKADNFLLIKLVSFSYYLVFMYQYVTAGFGNHSYYYNQDDINTNMGHSVPENMNPISRL